MVAAQPAAVATSVAPLPRGAAFVRFLARELAPFPGRAATTARIVVACVTVLVLCMTLRVPEAYLSVWMVTRFSMEESSQSLLTGIVFLVALTAGLAISLVCLTVAMDQPWLRFCLMAAFAGVGLFLRRTFVIGAVGFVIGLIGMLIMTVPDFIRVPEVAVRASLWLWSVFALPLAVAVAANLLIAPTDPENLLRAEITARLRAARNSIDGQLQHRIPDGTSRRLAGAGIARLLVLLKSAAVAHARVRARQTRYSAIVTLADRLVSAAAALDALSAIPLQGHEQQRLQHLADDCAHLTCVFEQRGVVQPRPHAHSIAADSSARLPVILELEHALDLLWDALEPQPATSDSPSAEAEQRLLVADAFANPEYIRYALKGALAVMLCYVLQSAVNWPGIRTCLITCLIVGLASEGATLQKGSLRIGGALVGAALGFLSILFLIPEMESITSLAVVVSAGSAVAGWVVVGSPRIAYAGVQLAFAFFLCVVQGFEPTWHLYTIRDRLVGILLGNIVITLVFYYVWPVQASREMWNRFSSALRTMARLATVGTRSADQRIVAAAAQDLRLQATRDLAMAQQLADEAAFESQIDGTQHLGVARLQHAAANTQSILLIQLALANQRPNVLPADLPDRLVRGIRVFDGDLAAALTAIAERATDGGRPPIPNLRPSLAAVAEVIDGEAANLTDPAAIPHLQARLALYREIVPQVERLGTAELAE